MKHFIKHTLDYQLTQQPPCNFDPLSWIALGLGAVGTAVNAITTENTNAKNYKYQRSLMLEQDYLNKHNMVRQANLNRGTLTHGYELENKYNSPSVQKAKMLAAGLNPYYNEAGAVAAQSNPNQSSVGLPSASLPSYQYQSPWAAFANLPSEFASVANATKAIAEAKKVGVDTTFQERAMEDYLNDIHEKWRGSKLANDYQAVITNWYMENGTSYLDEQDRKLSIEIGNLCAQGNLADAQKLLVEAQKNKQIKENALFDKIQGFLEDKAKFEAKNAEEQVNTTIAQGQMYKNQGIAALRSSDAAISQALTAEANGKAYRVQLRSAAKLNDAQLTKMASELVGAYVDQHGLHVDENERLAAQSLLKRQIVAQTKSMDAKAKQDRFNTYNPFTYLGQIFGGSGTAFLSKAIK